MFDAFTKLGKWLFIAIWLTIVIAVFFGESITKFVLHEMPFMGTSFTRVAWEQAGQCSGKACALDISCPRGGMFRDLQRHHLVPGTRRTMVEQMLGKGEQGSEEHCALYPLGMCGGFGIDMDYLRICYGHDDRIASVSHHQN